MREIWTVIKRRWLMFLQLEEIRQLPSTGSRVAPIRQKEIA